MLSLFDGFLAMPNWSDRIKPIKTQKTKLKKRENHWNSRVFLVILKNNWQNYILKNCLSGIRLRSKKKK